MPLPLLFALALVQTPQNQAAPQSGPYNFSTAPMLAEPFRLQITPKFDGKIEEDEWDPFTSSAAGKTYLQWSPGAIYAAATAPAGTDLLLSIDLGGDGWLVGDDNYEARVSTAGGKPTITVRRLDATNVAGPVWKELPGWGLASTATAASDGTLVTYELRLADAGLGVLPQRRTKVNARVDLVPSSDSGTTAVSPRVLSPIELVTNRAEGLPSNLHYGIEHAERTVSPGENAFIRFTFRAKGQAGVKKINIHSEGPAKEQTNEVTVPFPDLGSKGRSFVDYTTKVDASADLGYHVLKGTLTLSDGTPAIIETSYRIAPPVDLVVTNPLIKPDPHDRSLAISFYLEANTTKGVTGEVSVVVDPKFRIVNGAAAQKFKVLDSRGRSNRRVEIFVPGNTVGTYPFEFDVVANGKKSSITRFVTFGTP